MNGRASGKHMGSVVMNWHKVTPESSKGCKAASRNMLSPATKFGFECEHEVKSTQRQTR